MKLSKRIINKYYFFVTVMFLLGIVFLPKGMNNNAPLFYMFLGPMTFAISYFSIGEKLNTYVRFYYPYLMKKHSIHFGVRRGYALNPFNVFQNKKEFIDKNDTELERLVNVYGYSLKFVLISLFSFVVMTIVGFQIHRML